MDLISLHLEYRSLLQLVQQTLGESLTITGQSSATPSDGIPVLDVQGIA